jgi:histidine triad (HIT) family protein
MTRPVSYDPDNIFAKILRGTIPCTKVYEDTEVLAFMDVMPQADGHTLVIPKHAARGLLDLPVEKLAILIARTQMIAAAVVNGMQADGFSIMQFNEAAGGQTVFHVHFHVIPRWNGIALRQHAGTMEDRAVLEKHAAQIKASLA